MSCRIIFVLMFVCLGTFSKAQETFTNPLFPSGPDPWCIYKDGYYFYMHTTWTDITIWKTKNIGNLSAAEKKTVFIPPPHTLYSKNIWAPELHFLDGRWYIYFAADSGHNRDHRLWVLEHTGNDPLDGAWHLKGKLTTPEDKWSIDGTVYRHNDQLYLLWSGWEGDVNGRQDIYIAQMENPWTVKGPRVRLSSPRLKWETHGTLNDPNDVRHVSVNEGPQVLRNGNQLFLVYSASGCWTDHYALGMLYTSAQQNIMDSISWTKHRKPVFKQSRRNRVYATGHNSFFTSADGRENWILYHANSRKGQGCGVYRSPRAQKFTWKKNGHPRFGKPVKEKRPLALPGSAGQ